MEIQQKVSKGLLAGKVGRVLEVVVSGKTDDGVYAARSFGEAPDIDGLIFVNSVKTLNAGDFVKVRIKQTFDYDMIGELYEPAQ
jgi:ribosomal protein S12 methylthiotransferase